ncbi:hypothetical protein SLE2022_318450 [Rubroshorea leprosula]
MILSGFHFGQRRLLPSLSRRRQSFATATRMVSTTNNNKEKKEKVIVISGPTGAGKSRLALELAKRLNGEIISADSVQVYRGLDIGSAKPALSDRKEVPHHLVDILDPFEDYSVGQFFEDARQATRDVLDSGHVPIVTGGTGLYLRWFVYGKPDVPKASTEIAAKVYAEIADFERDGEWDAAVEMVVKAGDPKARSLPVNNWYRLRRSLEIIKSTGSPRSAFHIPYDSFKQQFDSSGANDSHNLNPSRVVPEQVTAKELDYEFICFFLSSPRLDLYRLIDLRCEEMLTGTDGILSEARWLLHLGLSPNSNSATRAIGYRHAMEYLSFKRLLGILRKGNLTWFCNEEIYHWLNASRPLEEVLNFICDAYHGKTGTLSVPQSLQMKKDISNRHEVSKLKAYRPKNRHFIYHEDYSDILDWIRQTQASRNGLVSI